MLTFIDVDIKFAIGEHANETLKSYFNVLFILHAFHRIY